MNLIEFLEMRNFNTTAKIKLVRHQDSRFDINNIYKNGMLDIYQSFQENNVFSNCQYIISFLGLENNKAKFIGVYKVLQEKPILDAPIPDNFLYPEMFLKDNFYYEMIEEPLLTDLKERLVIDWGQGTRSWHQWLDKNKPKQVIEILPVGYYNQFPGFLEFVLDADDLQKIINYPESNKEWHKMLSSVAGIYLIVDSKTGKQYVGSAYGKEGILGRWKKYAHTGHGGNEELKRLLDENPDSFKDFRFTILRTLQKELTKNEVIKYESIYKLKLGTRAFGLNLN